MDNKEKEIFDLVIQECVALIEELSKRPSTKWGDIIAAVKNLTPPHFNTWRCFHCQEVFTDPDEAEAHFGPDMLDEPICQIPDLAKLCRDQQKELRNLRSEDFSQSSKEIYAMGAKHHRELIEAEQKGYDAGLRDGRNEKVD